MARVPLSGSSTFASKAPHRQRIGCVVFMVEGRSRPWALRRSGLGLVTHRFDVVTVGADDEGAIVVRVVVRTQARRPVVASTGLEAVSYTHLTVPTKRI